MDPKIKVLIIDDSRLFRQILSAVLSEDSEIEVIGMAENPLAAQELLKLRRPDVITLDIEMPHMSGIEFLKIILSQNNPIPTIMCSTLTQKGSAESIECLRIGAVDYIPKLSDPKQLLSYASQIREKIKIAAKANVRKQLPYSGKKEPRLILPKQSSVTNYDQKIIVIGASTGGVEALSVVLSALPEKIPPVLVVLHIPKEFSASFTNRLNSLCKVPVTLALQNEPLACNHIYVAPGDDHLSVTKLGSKFYSHLSHDELVGGHRPAVDVLFSSVAVTHKNKVIAALLTGMGSDGAQGLKKINDSGGKTVVQDKETSVIWGMPGSAVKLDAAQHIMPLHEIAAKLIDLS